KANNWYQQKLSATIWNSTNGIGNIVASSAARAIANAATRSIVNGSDFGDNLLAGLPDVIGQTLGGLEANALSGERVFFGNKGLPEGARGGTGDGVAGQPTTGEDGGKVGAGQATA